MVSYDKIAVAHILYNFDFISYCFSWIFEIHNKSESTVSSKNLSESIFQMIYIHIDINTHILTSIIWSKRAQSSTKEKCKKISLYIVYCPHIIHILNDTPQTKRLQNKSITLWIWINRKQVYCAFIFLHWNCFFVITFEEWNFLQNVFFSLRNLIRTPCTSFSHFLLRCWLVFIAIREVVCTEVCMLNSKVSIWFVQAYFGEEIF